MSIPHRTAILLFVILALVIVPPAARALGPSCDAFAGYSRLMSNAFNSNTGGLNGIEGSLHCKLKPFVGWEANLSHYGFGAAAAVPRTTVGLGGLRLTVGAAGFRLWVHGLGGLEHSANSGGAVSISDSKFAYALGAGADMRFLPSLSWRLSGDYLTATSTPSGGSHERISTGLVLRF